MESKSNGHGARADGVGLRQIVEVMIIVGAVFAADIALARIVDIALDAFVR